MVEKEFIPRNEIVLNLFNTERLRNTETIWIVTMKDYIHPIKVHDIGIDNTETTCNCYFNDILKCLKEDNTNEFVFIHNHPTEDPYPSLEDIKLTLSLIDYAKENNIYFDDHYILSKDESFSLKQANIGFDFYKVKNGAPFLTYEPNKKVPSLNEIDSFNKQEKKRKFLVLRKKLEEKYNC